MNGFSTPQAAWARLQRRALLAMARRLSPQHLLLKSRQGAWQAAQQAAKHSAAYRTLLQESGLASINGLAAAHTFQQLPVLSKDNTFGRFSLAQLSRPLGGAKLAHRVADVLTSSGRGGPGFGFRLSTRAEHEHAWFNIDLGLQDTFGVDDRSTLLVNCLPMGVVFPSRAVTVANVSVREDMACAILRDVGPQFAQTLLCTDPLFIRPLLDEARRTGVDWQRLQTSVILGEEMLVEPQREYIAARMGLDLDAASTRMIGSSFGVGELGLNLLFETRSTIAMRRALREPGRARQWLPLPAGDCAAPSLFCHNPLRCHIEVLNPDAHGYGELCFTMLGSDAVIPLPRYATGDLGCLVPAATVADVCRTSALAPPWLPVVAVCGRIKDRHPGLPSVEQVKEWLYTDAALADTLSGAFKLELAGHGQAVLTLQTAGETPAADHAACSNWFTAQAAAAGYSGLDVRYRTQTPTKWGKNIDHERKFNYAQAGNLQRGSG